MTNILITGHTSGLGKSIYDLVCCDCEVGDEITGWSFEDNEGVDLTDPSAVEFAAEGLGVVDIVINCAGVNFIDWLPDISVGMWDHLMNLNARAPWLIAKTLINQGKLNNPSTILNIVSNASHMPMTNSAAYNASKGAAHILTLQMARELKKTHGTTVFGISPNKMHSTRMSEYIDNRVCGLRGWTLEEAAEYQAANLPAGEETDPQQVAEFIAYLLSTPERHKFLNGCIIPYGA